MLLFAATERQTTVHLERPIVAVDNSAVDYQSCPVHKPAWLWHRRNPGLIIFVSFFIFIFLTNIRSHCRSQSSRHINETWKFNKNLKLFVSLISLLPASVPVCFEDGNGWFGWSSGSFRAAAQKVWSSQSPSKLFYPSSLSFTRSRLPTRV